MVQVSNYFTLSLKPSLLVCFAGITLFSGSLVAMSWWWLWGHGGWSMVATSPWWLRVHGDYQSMVPWWLPVHAAYQSMVASSRLVTSPWWLRVHGGYKFMVTTSSWLPVHGGYQFIVAISQWWLSREVPPIKRNCRCIIHQISNVPRPQW